MRLSEAIRLGATLRPKLVGALNGQRLDGQYGTCALGAAFEAAKIPYTITIASEDCGGIRSSVSKGEKIEMHMVPAAWECILSKPVACFVCGWVQIGKQTISHLNDDHELTRERIADEVEKWEPKKRTRKAKTAPEPTPAEVDMVLAQLS